MKKLIAMLGAVVAAVTSAFAATPVAVWEGNFTSTQGGYTITAPEGSTTTIGDTIVIGDAGVKIGTHPNGTQAFTAIIKYRNLSLTAEGSQTIFVGSNSANGNNIGVFMHAENGGLQGIAQNAAYSNKVSTQMPAEGVIAVEHASSVSTSVLIKDATSAAYNDNTLKYSGHNYDSLTIFGGAMADASSNVAGVATGVVIEKIALFREKLSQDEVNAYAFPSEKGDYYATVDGERTFAELTWATADGTSVADISDTTKTLVIEGTGTVTVPEDFARTVRLDAGVTIVPASGTTSGTFIGDGTVIFNGVLPTAAQQNVFKSGSKWGGTCVLKDYGSLNTFDPNNFGNTRSTLRFVGCAGYFKNANFTINPTVDLVNSETEGKAYGLKVNNGWSGNVITFTKLTGNGKLLASKPGGAPTVRLVCPDISGFTGAFEMDTEGNISAIVLGSGAYTHSRDDDGKIVLRTMTIPAAVTLKNPLAGGIVVKQGATVTTGTIGKLTGAITIDGTLVTTTNTGSDDKTFNGNGTLVLNATSAHLIQEGKITFGGTIKALLNQNNGNQVVLNHGGNIFPSRPEFILSKTTGSGTLTLSNHCTTYPVTVRDFSGNIDIANNYGNGAGDRVIDTLQTKETTYSGVFRANSTGGGTRSLGLTVRGDADHQYQALTLSGANLSGGTLTIAEYGKVNLTGSWAGNIVVNGILTSPNQIAAEKLSTTKPEATKVVETHDEESGIYTYEPNYVPRTDPTDVYATSKALTEFVLEDGSVTTLIDGDTIHLDSHLQGDVWHGGADLTDFAAHQIVINREIDLGAGVGIPENGKVTITLTDGTKGVYLYGNIGANATIDGAGYLYLGHTGGNGTVADGVTISCKVGFQGTNTATINGAVTISGDIVTTDGCHIKLAEGATLTTAKIAEEGDAITHVTTDVADSHVEYDGTKYVIVANTPEPEVPTWLEGEDKATVEAYNTWKEANEASITEATTDEMLLEAFLFGCEPTAEAIAAARAAFVVESIDIDSDGIPVIGYTEEGYNGVVEVIGSATIDGTYTVEAVGENTAKFFKLQLVLPSQATPVEED